MRNKIILSLFLLIVIAIYGCAQPTQTVQQAPDLTEEPEEVIEEESDLPEEETEPEEVIEISPEVEELLNLANKKVSSISYRYRGPENEGSLYDFFIVANKIKYILDPPVNDPRLDDEAYDTIYLDKDAKTAVAYCDDRTCRKKGMKIELNYDDSYIITPFDLLENIKSAEKLGEESIGKRSIWKISTDTSILWIDTFFGVPLKAEFAGNTYVFEQMTFNGVSDEDITPS